MLQKAAVPISTAACPDGLSLANKETQIHPESRATRLVQDTTRFLLVSVSRKARDDTFQATLAKWVREGVEHGGIFYRFLGYTESHVKAGKLMFFHEGEGWTVERMLETFGDLPGVYLKSGYGKYAARLGLSFSSTLQSLDIPPECAVEIPDLIAPDGSVHSDGCGMIRDNFAAQLCVRHDLPLDTTVFQIRRGGIKGLLVRYPDIDFDSRCRAYSRTRRGHYMVAYRPSMFKYPGGPTCLELNNCNSPSVPARLNVQFIALLLTLGVPFTVFKRLVQDQLDLIGSILSDREKALQYVKGELDAAAENDFAQGLYAMLLARQDLSEPYVRYRLQNFQRIQYSSLRNKMNIRIPESAYLFGVVDEAGALEPNEVHINLPNRSGVLVRDVIVGRNPSYHPGDFRKLRAVDHPSLRHHRNCIVFSSKAAHSIPDTMAGGDLDGDMYFVCWDPGLIFPREMPPFSRMQSATSAAQAGTASTSVPLNLSDMPKAAVDTFMQLKFNRLLGMMANEWTRRVELTPDLAKSAFCQGLVPLIESALDMLKSGEDFATLEEQFKRLQSCHAVRSRDAFKGPIQRLRDIIPEGESDKLQNLRSRHDDSLVIRAEDPSQWNRHILEAASVLPRFNQELCKAIDLDKNYAESYASSAYRDVNDRHTDAVKHFYHSQYFGGGSEEQRREQRMRASAWYYYGYSQNKQAFAWLGEKYLNGIKAWWSNGDRPPLFVGAASPRSHAPLLSSFGTQIDGQSSQYSSSRGVDGIKGHVPMEIDGETDLDDEHYHKRELPGGCEAQRRDTQPLDVVIPDPRPRCSEAMALSPPVKVTRVPVASNPKPSAPVATQITIPPSRCSVSTHEWTVLSANGFARRYLCKCGIEVREKKENGFWVTVQYNIGEHRKANHTPPRQRHLLPVAEFDDESLAHDTQGTLRDENSEGSVYVVVDDPIPTRELALPARLRRSSADRTSGGTAASDAPSSLCELPLRRLPRHPGSDIVASSGRSRQVSGSRRTSGLTTEFSTPASLAAGLSPPAAPRPSDIIPRPAWPLVSADPKPKAPVATPHVPPCRTSGAIHQWKIWGSATHRRYTCLDCSTVVKERKMGHPEAWVPAG